MVHKGSQAWPPVLPHTMFWIINYDYTRKAMRIPVCLDVDIVSLGDWFLWRDPVAYPGILFRGGQQIQLRTEDRENGDLGVVAP